MKISPNTSSQIESRFISPLKSIRLIDMRTKECRAIKPVKKLQRKGKPEGKNVSTSQKNAEQRYR